MDRREAIKKAALLMGGALLTPTAMGVLNGCRARPGVNWEPAYFNDVQARLVTTLADIVLPQDEHGPAASALGVPSFIEEMIYKVYDEKSRNAFINGLETFNTSAGGQSGGTFLEMGPEDQLLLTESKNREMVGWSGDEWPEELYFFRLLKELTITGYFTTEVGATQVLQHEAIPGRYDGCVPLDEVGKTWAV